MHANQMAYFMLTACNTYAQAQAIVDCMEETADDLLDPQWQEGQAIARATLCNLVQEGCYWADGPSAQELALQASTCKRTQQRATLLQRVLRALGV